MNINQIHSIENAIKEEDLTKAEELINEVLSENNNDSVAWQVQSSILELKGDDEGSTASLIRANELQPDDENILIELGERLLLKKQAAQAIDAFIKAIHINPNNYKSSLGIARAMRDLGKHDDACTSYERAISLYAQSHHAAVKELRLNNFSFLKFQVYQNGGQPSTLTAVSTDGKALVKVQIFRHELKQNSIQEEYELMKSLNEKGCVSCPQAHAFGIVSKAELLPLLNDNDAKIVQEANGESFEYIVQQYIDGPNNAPIPDVMLAVLEQKALGYFHSDVRAANALLDKKSGITYLIDYDQAIPLEDDVKKMNNVDYFNWCTQNIKERYTNIHVDSFLLYYKDLDWNKHVWPCFRDGALNLAFTRLFSNQITTAAAAKIYHSIQEKDVFIDGERDLISRRPLLDQIEFTEGERILDVGCSSGILSQYLARRGANVTGYELDPEVIVGAKMVSNILGLPIEFKNVDLDAGADLPELDTVMLFSVIHHTKYLEANCLRIANATKRIIIECRLHEGGLKPVNGSWENTSAWDYQTVDELTAGLERLFPGFKLKKNYGQVDRSRFIMEFTK